jgi:small-conductance mechanosensitive channel
MRLMYDSIGNTPETMKKKITEHEEKEHRITSKINKIITDHEEKLVNRIRERQMRNIRNTRSDICNDTNDTGELDWKLKLTQSREMELLKQGEKGLKKKAKSVELEKRRAEEVAPPSPTKRRVSADFIKGGLVNWDLRDQIVC